MSNALGLITYIFNKFVNLLFNEFNIITDVSLGWISVVIIIFSIMINNILNVAKASQGHQIARDKSGGDDK